jgi:uncharacterized surface protein with fasciclin (FAS1) repeats
MNLKRTNPLLISAKLLLLILTFSVAMIGCSDDDDNGPTQQTVLEIAVDNPNFDVLEAAALKAGNPVTSVLSGNAQITVFAPTDAAFVTHFGVTTEAQALAEVADLTQAEAIDLLTFHVIAGSEIKAGDIASGTTTVTTARGTNNKAFVTKTGSTVTINNATVTSADVDASNGVIHIINAVLTPPTGNIVTIAVADDRFDILAAAVTEAGLATTLQGAGPLTVFAPTDDAFLTLLRTIYGNASLNEAGAIAAIEDLTASSTPLSLTKLTDILKYHVINQKAAYSINLANGPLDTFKGGTLNTVTVAIGPPVTVDGLASTPSNVVVPNVSATNGVIHAIDKVLLFD